MTYFKKILAALAVLSTAAILCGCTEQETEYNYDLLGGEVISNSDYNVDIRKDNTDETDKADEQNSTPTAPTSAPDVTTSNTDTTSTPSAQPTTPTRPAQSTKPTETSEPTTSTDTTSTPDETSKVETTEKEDTTTSTTSTTSTPTQQYDANGFPANPAPFQEFYDSTGQKWSYELGQWHKSGGGGVTVTDFWTGEVL